MNRLAIPIILLLAIAEVTRAQPSKKADRRISAALESYSRNLSRIAMTDDSIRSSRAAYVWKQFEKSGLKPGGPDGSWYDDFEVETGRELTPQTSLAVNGRQLVLLNDFFPLSFSPNRQVDASVAMALAENGVPWFSDLSDILNAKKTGTSIDTLQHIFEKAEQLAAKGASALFIYNKSASPDLEFYPLVRHKISAIPVVFISKQGLVKYFPDDSETMEINLRTELNASVIRGRNLEAYIDNGSATTMIAGVMLANQDDLAVLLEISDLARKAKDPQYNFRFVVLGSPKARQQFAFSKLAAPASRVHQVVLIDTAITQTSTDSVQVLTPDGSLNKVKTGLSLITGGSPGNLSKSVN